MRRRGTTAPVGIVRGGQGNTLRGVTVHGRVINTEEEEKEELKKRVLDYKKSCCVVLLAAQMFTHSTAHTHTRTSAHTHTCVKRELLGKAGMTSQ